MITSNSKFESYFPYRTIVRQLNLLLALKVDANEIERVTERIEKIHKTSIVLTEDDTNENQYKLSQLVPGYIPQDLYV